MFQETLLIRIWNIRIHCRGRSDPGTGFYYYGGKMKKLYLWSLMLVLLAVPIFAEDYSNDTKLPHYFGIGAGFVTGFGLSYRYWPENLGIQVDLCPVLSLERSLFSIGVSGLYAIKRLPTTSFFIYAGGNYFKEKDGYYESDRFGLGGGFGVEFGRSNLCFDLQCGFQYFNGTNIQNYGLYPSGEIALYYRI
jgi:hypothetical protein